MQQEVGIFFEPFVQLGVLAKSPAFPAVTAFTPQHFSCKKYSSLYEHTHIIFVGKKHNFFEIHVYIIIKVIPTEGFINVYELMIYRRYEDVVFLLYLLNTR